MLFSGFDSKEAGTISKDDVTYCALERMQKRRKAKPYKSRDGQHIHKLLGGHGEGTGYTLMTIFIHSNQ